MSKLKGYDFTKDDKNVIWGNFKLKNRKNKNNENDSIYKPTEKFAMIEWKYCRIIVKTRKLWLEKLREYEKKK